VSVDAEGRLVDHLVVAYTNKAFIASAVSAVKAWTYEPAKVRGRARASRVDLVFSFKADLVATVQSSAVNFLQDLFGERYEFRPSLLRDLDHIPTPVHVVTPTIPNGVLAEGEERVVTVEFYIDQEGKVRIPAVSREDADDRLAAVAVTAVEQWRFEPPVRKGSAVLVLAQQDFHFMAKPKVK
jgi:TonB family protein